MAIRLTCDCGKELNVKDELDGKRIKCPDCRASLKVEADTPGTPAGKSSSKTRASKPAAKKSGMMLYVLLGGGVLVLGLCCLGVAGGAGAWYFLSGSATSALEGKIVGKWVADTPKTPPAKIEDVAKLAIMVGDIEFKADGTVIDNTLMTPITKGKWKGVAARGDVLTVELSQAPLTKTLDLRVVSNDTLKITPADLKMEYTFKRSP
jgi:hypothetical protein